MSRSRTTRTRATPTQSPADIARLRDLLVALGFDRGSASVLAALHIHGPSLGSKTIRDITDISPYLLSTTLKGLTAAGIVNVTDDPTGTPHRGRPMWTLHLAHPLRNIITEKARTERDHLDAATTRILEAIE